jgi:hypothetical protein
LVDAPRPGTPPLNRWTQAELAAETVSRGIAESISAGSVGRFLREADLKPHRIRGWLNTPRDEQFDERCQDVCEAYRLAPERAAAGIETRSIDEMTGVQALERAAPTLPMRPGSAELREYEYIRHGTLTLIAAFDVEGLADVGWQSPPIVRTCDRRCAMLQHNSRDCRQLQPPSAWPCRSSEDG